VKTIKGRSESKRSGKRIDEAESEHSPAIGQVKKEKKGLIQQNDPYW